MTYSVNKLKLSINILIKYKRNYKMQKIRKVAAACDYKLAS